MKHGHTKGGWCAQCRPDIAKNHRRAKAAEMERRHGRPIADLKNEVLTRYDAGQSRSKISLDMHLAHLTVARWLAERYWASKPGRGRDA